MKKVDGGWFLSDYEYLVLKEIAAGGKPEIEQYGQFIVVSNPDFKPDDGTDPNLVLSLYDKADYGEDDDV